MENTSECTRQHNLRQGSFWPAELFDKIAGDLRSTYVSQVLPAFHAFKGEMKKIETVFQDADLATKIAEEFKHRTSKLQAEFQFPVVDETATHHELLMQAVDKVMDVLDVVTEDVGKNVNTDVGHVRQAFQDARQPVKDVVLFAGECRCEFISVLFSNGPQPKSLTTILAFSSWWPSLLSWRSQGCG